MSTNSFDAALLVAKLDDLSTPHPIASVISAATTSTRHRLIILLLSPLFNRDTATDGQGVSRTERLDDVQKLLSFVYVQATLVAQDMGKMRMGVDVLLRGFDEDVPENLAIGIDVCFRVESDNITVPIPHSISSLPQVLLPGISSHEQPLVQTAVHHPTSRPPLFPVVVIGGTFDHLHAGHKVLLSMAAWIASEKIVVGVTDDALLTNKSFKEVLEPLTLRIENVRAFLAFFRPGIVYDIVPITDVYGPTGWDPNIQALVVSKETIAGADSIAAYRKAHSLPPLETFVIDVISSSSSNLDVEDAELLKRTKMSSTAIRESILQERSRQVGN